MSVQGDVVTLHPGRAIGAQLGPDAGHVLAKLTEDVQTGEVTQAEGGVDTARSVVGGSEG